MGSGSWLLAPITGPAKDNGKGGLGPHPELCSSKVKSHLTTRNAPGPQGPQARTGVGAHAPGLSFHIMITDSDHESNQANRAISTSKLNTSPRLHTWPINVVVFHGSQGRTRFKGGFPLRCLQRLSRPYIATLHCGWRHNSSTRGTSIPVLSY